MPFIHDDFLLKSDAARRLYHEFARDEPILDYHNHLPPQDIASNRQFNDLFDIWLGGDHYKWRAMRTNGVEERFCTGDASTYEKFLAWARTVPHTLRNPLYHWTHLELARTFGIFDLLDEHTAPGIWEAANEQLKSPELSAQGLLKKFDVRALCTTDDPAESLQHHKALADSDFSVRVYPTFRPDKAFGVNNASVWNEWIKKLGATTNREISSLDDLLSAIKQRHDDFHAIGARLSDHGFNHLPVSYANEDEAKAICGRALSGQSASDEEASGFAGFLMLFLGRLDAQKGWTKQLHLGAQRKKTLTSDYLKQLRKLRN